jgi:hypothetical protein
MTYLELYEKAQKMLDRNEITLGEYEKMIKPLEAEVNTGQVKALPSAQPEVIRCRDCRYTRDGQENYGDYMCIKLYMFRNKDDFCSRGERREDGETD